MALKKIFNLISSVLVVLIALTVFAVAGVRLLGLEVFTVLSGSMEPEYPVGSLIYVRHIEPEKLEVGDVITFRIGGGMAATHRIAQIDRQGGSLSFITKGDANDSNDASAVSGDSIIGTPVFTVPRLGYLASYIQSPPGLYWAIAFCFFALALSFIPELSVKTKEN